jgi:hypothetical protein
VVVTPKKPAYNGDMVHNFLTLEANLDRRLEVWGTKVTSDIEARFATHNEAHRQLQNNCVLAMQPLQDRLNAENAAQLVLDARVQPIKKVALFYAKNWKVVTGFIIGLLIALGLLSADVVDRFSLF